MYNRVLIKLSGEALSGNLGHGLDYPTLESIAKSIKKVHDLGVKIGVVVGGGNYWRGRQHQGMDHTTADQIGMLATVMNALAVADAIKAQGVGSRAVTAINMSPIAERFKKENVDNYLDNGEVVVFGAGTGNPFFSTDSAAALRAAEIGADLIMKATMVDGVYNKDPGKNSDAVMYDEITYLEVLNKELGVMDFAAISLCKDNKIPISVFNLKDPDNIVRVIKGEKVGTIVK